MSIRLQFVLSHAVSSSLIAWFSAGHFSHVDAVLPKSGMLLGAQSRVIGSYPAGVQIRHQNYAPWQRRVEFEVSCTATQSRRFYKFLREQVGKPYDHSAIWGFVTGRDWRQDDSWICSELQAAALEYAGVLPKLYLAANKITPVALALAVSAAGGTVVNDF